MTNPYGSQNNRLEFFEVYDGSHVLQSTTYYFYDYEPITGGQSGNVERIVKRVAGSNHYTATRFDYGANGRTVAYVMSESWDWDNTGTCAASSTCEI